MVNEPLRADRSAESVRTTPPPASSVVWLKAAVRPGGASERAVSVSRAVSPARSTGRSKAPETRAGRAPSRSEIPAALPLVRTAYTADPPGASGCVLGSSEIWKVRPRRRARQEHTAMMPEPVGSVILVTP